MGQSPFERATRIADKALGGFKNAQRDLVLANSILNDAAEAHRAEAAEWRRRVEEEVKLHETHAARAVALAERNQKTIAKLADLIGD